MSQEIVTVGDLKVVLSIIGGAAQRGAIWGAEDLSRVGALYDKLARIVVAAEKMNTEKEDTESPDTSSNMSA